MHLAAAKGDLAELRKLVEAGGDILSLDPNMGVSVLHKAIYSGNDKAVDFLLAKGALIDLQSFSNGNTPLHDALYFKNGKDVKIIKSLLEKGASLSLRNRAGLTPAESAELLGDKEALQLIRNEYNTRYPVPFRRLMDAVKHNEVDRLKTFVTENPKLVNTPDEQGFTPLIWAAREGYQDIVVFLLKNKADPNQEDVWMRANAGHKASFWGRASVLKTLIDHGLNLDAQGGYNGYTALHDAVARSHDDVVQLLLDCGAKFDIKGHDGKTAIDLAKVHGDQPILAMFAKRKV